MISLSIRCIFGHRTKGSQIHCFHKLRLQIILEGISIIERHICTKAQYESYERQVHELIRKTEQIQQTFSGTDNSNEALLLLERKHTSFRPKEVIELEWLFGKYAGQQCPIDIPSYAKRQVFWRSRYNMVVDAEVKKIIELAMHAYGTLKP